MTGFFILFPIVIGFEVLETPTVSTACQVRRTPGWVAHDDVGVPGEGGHDVRLDHEGDVPVEAHGPPPIEGKLGGRDPKEIIVGEKKHWRFAKENMGAINVTKQN